MMKTGCEVKKVYTSKDKDGNEIWFSFCKYLDMKQHSIYGDVAGVKGKKSFAFVRDASTGKMYDISGSSVTGRKVAPLKKNGKLDGVKYSY